MDTREMKEVIEQDRIFMVCGSDGVAKDMGDMLKRVASALSAVDVFSDFMCKLDEDDPNLADTAAPAITRLTLTLMQLYPNARQFTEDIKSIGDFTVRSI